MELNSPTPQQHDLRRQTLINEMVPTLRRFNLSMPDDQLIALVANMADLRLMHADVS